MTGDIVIVGCGGHGREALGVVHAVNRTAGLDAPWRVAGFVDDLPSADNLDRLDRLGEPFLGSVAWLGDAPAGTHVLLAIGHPVSRRMVADRIEPYGLPAPPLVHPDATVGGDVYRPEGLLAFPGSRVTTNVTLGRHVHLNQNATVGHDCVLGDFVSVNPQAAVSGGCHIGAGTMLGAGSVVLQGLRVGAGATVGAAACVVRCVPDGAIVKGVPAR